jgi:hypothetical protein
VRQLAALHQGVAGQLRSIAPAQVQTFGELSHDAIGHFARPLNYVQLAANSMELHTSTGINTGRFIGDFERGASSQRYGGSTYSAFAGYHPLPVYRVTGEFASTASCLARDDQR